ncbi:MAG: hypothetical protein U0694_18735 [Anaerolineae bacterium]
MNTLSTVQPSHQNLRAAPQVKIIATSRQRLNQSGETILNLEGMDFPDWETPADALEYSAVKLFDAERTAGTPRL